MCEMITEPERKIPVLMKADVCLLYTSQISYNKIFFDEINKNIFTNKYYYAIMIIRKIDIEF